ncbi:unnamed protein product [Hapterophycus canaliculatus]
MDGWSDDHVDPQNPYAPDCASRAAEGFYVGALYGTVWGVLGRASASPISPSTPAMGALRSLSGTAPQSQPAGLGRREAAGYLRAFSRGAAGYGVAAASTAGVFGVFVGVVNAGTCACERFTGKKGWLNSAFGGAAAGLSVALLSRHTRTPPMVAGYVAGSAAITSIVAFATGPPLAS